MKTVKMIGAVVLVATLVLGLLPGMSLTALAYNTDSYSYKDANGNMQSCLIYEKFDASMWEIGDITGNANWYVVSQDTMIYHQLTLLGNVHLILCDGVTLTISSSNSCAIEGYGPGGHDCSLTIYGQSSGTGALVADGATSAIYVRNSLTINGGSVTANGYYDGIFTNFGNVTINGGKVTAKGAKVCIHAGADVTITSGEVSVTGTDTDSFGIDCKELIISGGTVSSNSKNVALNGLSKTTISGGNVTATSDNAALSTMDLTISGSAVVNVTGGTGGMAAGSSPSKATITGGTVTAVGGTSGLGDGIAYNDITISGGTVTANGCNGIGGDTVSINNGIKSVTADGKENAIVGATSISISDELIIKEPAGGEVGDAVIDSLNVKAILDGTAVATHALIVPKKETAYAFTKGDGAEWQKGSTGGLNFTVKGSPDDTGTFANFDGIQTDGAAVSAGNFITAAGSVKLTLKADYLETLSVGEHTLKAVFKDGGSAEAKFTVKDAAAEKYTFTFTKLWQGDREKSIDWVLYHSDGTVAHKKFSKKIISKNEWYYEATFTTDEDYYIIEKVPDGYYVRYDNVGAHAGVTDRCYSGGKIINRKVPKTGDAGNPGLWASMVLIGVSIVCCYVVSGKRKKEQN